MKIVTLNEIKQRIQNRFPNQPYQIIQYSKVTFPFVIKCLKCNRISQYQSFKNFINSGTNTRKFLCQCYNQKSNFNKHQKAIKQIEEILSSNNLITFIDFDYKQDTKKNIIHCKCNKCNQDFKKDFSSFIKNSNCPYCMSLNNLNTEGFKVKLPKDYTLISDYINAETKILIKHSCGFIWKVKPHNFVYKINHGYIGCPKCNHKKSKGQKKIQNFLEEKSISFIRQNSFEWQSNPLFRYDFFLPDYKLIIEYMGRQHYEEVEFFHDSLQERQLHDKIKKEQAILNNLNYLQISYKDYQNIQNILTCWFNDYSERK